MSPTVLRSGPYRFFFFSSDRAERPHVHVARERKLVKLWLDPIRVAESLGFGARELARISTLARQHEADLLRAWHDYFGIDNGGGNARSGH